MNNYSPCDANPEPSESKNTFPCRLVTLSLDQLYPHPSYVKHNLSVSVPQLTALVAVGDFVAWQPIMVTQAGIVIDGYARWELARRQGRRSILCLEYELSEEEALRRLILSHRPSQGFNGYCRSLLALDLEPYLRERARENQQVGGHSKGSTNLTEAQRIDVRSQAADVANVSTGNFTKAKLVVAHADPVIQEATKCGEVRVHRAWQWSSLSRQHQLEKLEEFRSCKGVRLVSRKLIQKHMARMLSAPTTLVPPTLGDVLRPLIREGIAQLDAILLSQIDVPGRIAYFTKDAMRVLKPGRVPECKSATC